MSMWFSVGPLVRYLLYENRNGDGRCGAKSMQLFSHTLRHTMQWYAVVGTIAVAAAPVVYTTMRVIATKRKAFILRTAFALSNPSTDVVNTVGDSLPHSSFFLSNERILVSSKRILDAERAMDPEFANAFATEMLRVYTNGALGNLLHLCCRDLFFHSIVFLLCGALNRCSGLMVNGASNTCNGCNTSGGELMVCHSLYLVTQRVWCYLFHGGLLQHAVEGMDTLYIFFSFSQSSSRMVERWFPWLGSTRFAVLRFADPSVYLDAHWRSPEVADRVWRAMTPKGFAIMCFCRSLAPLLRPSFCDMSRYMLSASSLTNNGTHASKSLCSQETCEKRCFFCLESAWKQHLLLSLHRLCSFIFNTGKTSIIVLMVTSCATTSSFSWLPFPCNGGPQYVALCYAEMALTLWSSLVFLLHRRARQTLQNNCLQNPLPSYRNGDARCFP